MRFQLAHTRTCVVIFGVVLLVSSASVFAAEISDVQVTDVSDSSAVVQWKTDIDTDATINFGLDTRFGIVRDPSFTTKDHLLTIDNLDPSTTYHFRVISADASGNKSTTAGFVFTTKSAANKNVTENILKLLEKVKDPKDLKKIDQKVRDIAVDLVKPPTILGATKVVPDITTAEISWTTDRESGSVVYLAPEGEYRAGSDKP